MTRETPEQARERRQAAWALSDENSSPDTYIAGAEYEAAHARKQTLEEEIAETLSEYVPESCDMCHGAGYVEHWTPTAPYQPCPNQDCAAGQQWEPGDEQ